MFTNVCPPMSSVSWTVNVYCDTGLVTLPSKMWEAVPIPTGTIPTSTIPTFQRSTDVEVCRRHRSSSTSTLIVLSTLRSTLGDHAFPVAAARACNALPSSAKFIAMANKDSVIHSKTIRTRLRRLEADSLTLRVWRNLSFCKVPATFLAPDSIYSTL